MKSPVQLSAVLFIFFAAVSAVRTKTVTKTVTKNVGGCSTTSAGSCKATNPISNGGFETGSLSSWLTGSDTQDGTSSSITAKSPGSNNNKAGTASKYGAYFSTVWTMQQTNFYHLEMIQKFYPCPEIDYTFAFDYQFDPKFNTVTQITVEISYEATNADLGSISFNASPGNVNDGLGNPVIKGVWYTTSSTFTAQRGSSPHTVTITSTCFDDESSRSSGYCGFAIDNVILTPQSS